MKKKVSIFLAAILSIVVFPAATFAAGPTTDVTGVVTNNGKPVVHAHVIVICDNNKKSTFTDSTGTYLVTYKAAKCPDGATANVTATQGNKGGVNSGKVNGVTEKLNVAIVNVSLPELGLVTGIGAGLIGGGAFLAIRRRQLSDHRA